MPDLIIPIAIPGAGKSTFAERFFAQDYNTRIHSTDKIREELGSVYDQGQNDLVFETWHRRICDDLIAGYRVYADATNLSKRARVELEATAREAAVDRYFAGVDDVRSHLIVFHNVAEAIQRNARRDRVVPDDAMLKMLDQYEQFCLDLPRQRHLYSTITEIERFG